VRASGNMPGRKGNKVSHGKTNSDQIDGAIQSNNLPLTPFLQKTTTNNKERDIPVGQVQIDKTSG
jgi:hypothetical protein